MDLCFPLQLINAVLIKTLFTLIVTLVSVWANDFPPNKKHYQCNKAFHHEAFATDSFAQSFVLIIVCLLI